MATAKGIRAGKAFVETYADNTPLARGLKQASGMVAAFSARVGEIGGKVRNIGAAVFAGASAVLAPLGASAKIFDSIGSEINDMSTRTGIAAEDLSTLGFAAEQGGADMATLETGIKKMQKTLAAADDESKQAIETLGKLGVTVADLKGKKPDEQYRIIAERLMAIKDPGRRAAAAIALFGKSGTQLLPMMEDLKETEQLARDLGLVVSGQSAAAADKFGDKLSALWKQLKMTAFAIGEALAPELGELLTRGSKAVAWVIRFIRENKGLIVSVGKIVLGVAAAGAAFMIVGTAMQAVGSVMAIAARGIFLFGGGVNFAVRAAKLLYTILAFSVGGAAKIAMVSLAKLWAMIVAGAASVGSGIMAFLSVLFTPMGLLAAAVVGLGIYFIYASGVIQTAMRGLKGLFRDVKNDAVDAFGGIRDAIMAGDIQAAAEVLWAFITLEWQRGVNLVNKIWLQAKRFFLDTWNSAVANASGFFINAWAALEGSWVQTVDFLKDTWTAFAKFMVTSIAPAIGKIENWLTKSLARAFGADEEEAERAGKEIEASINAWANDFDAKSSKAIVDREATRKKRLDDIEKNRAGAQAGNDAMLDAQLRGTEGDEAEGLASGEAKLKSKKEALADAIARAAAARRGKGNGPEGPRKPGIPDIDVGGKMHEAKAAAGIGAHDVRTQEGAKSLFASLRQARDPLLGVQQKSLAIQQRSLNEELRHNRVIEKDQGTDF